MSQLAERRVIRVQVGVNRDIESDMQICTYTQVRIKICIEHDQIMQERTSY